MGVVLAVVSGTSLVGKRVQMLHHGNELVRFVWQQLSAGVSPRERDGRSGAGVAPWVRVPSE